MPAEEIVLVKCRFSRGGFPAERVFHIQGSQGGIFSGIAPVDYCYSQDRTPLRGDIPRGEKVDGLLAGVTLGTKNGDEALRVYLPNSEVYDIDSDLIESQGDPTRVSLQS